jgi:cyclic beta-1,2-glucan glucanotransferase
MDFNTRNLYRNVIEKMAKHTKINEVKIAQETLMLANEGSKEFERHVGYYLIDDGKKYLESRLGYFPPFKERLERTLKSFSAYFYIGTIFVFTLFIDAVCVYFSVKSHPDIISIVSIAILALFPISNIVILSFNCMLTHFLHPAILPKMHYKQQIPIEFKSLIIVPMMLTNPEDVQEEIDQLEIRYLANTDPSLCFGLFCDFEDTSEKVLKEDNTLLDVALRGMQKLEQKYGNGKFFLFHRQRTWSPSENAWIGWERKRGKLESLNRYLMGEDLSENILYFGERRHLNNICFVITLDSDTQLPKMQAKN